MIRTQRAIAVVALVVLSAASAGLGTGCKPAQAAPLEVTYYYLPG